MDPISELNIYLKRTKFDLLHFNIEKRINDQKLEEYKASLLFEKPLHTDSNWFLNEVDAKFQCAQNTLNQLSLQPNEDINRPIDKKPIVDKLTLLLASVFFNMVLLITFKPVTFYILFPLLILVVTLLTIPWLKYKHCRILQCKGNRVIARTTKSYDKFIIPIKYVNYGDKLIDLSNGINETQNTDQSNFLAIATKDIFLSLIVNEENRNHEDPHYKILPKCGFRVSFLNGFYSANMTIVKKDGTVLVYQNTNVDPSLFVQSDLPVYKVKSKQGVHYVPAQYTRNTDLSAFEKYQIINLIYFDWLTSFFYI